MLEEGDRRPTAALEIQGEEPLTTTEVQELRTLVGSWIPGADEQIRTHVESYDPDSVTGNRKWGNLVFNRALFRHAITAIENDDYFIERSNKVHDFYGKTVIRLPLFRDGEQLGVHVVFDRGVFPEVDEAEDFLYTQKRISRELAAYRFNSLPYEQRMAVVERRQSLLRTPSRSREDRAFLLETFPHGIAVSRDKVLMRP